MKSLIKKIVISCLIFQQGYGQSIKPLNVGDTIPNITFNHIIGYKIPKEKLYNFNNHLIIIDFWATWCGSCLESFPNIYKLQKNLGDSLQILLVNSLTTKDNYEKIERFLSERKAAYTFPSIAQDTILTSLFPHTLIPYDVWIVNKKIVAITESITEENIKKALSGNFIDIGQTKKIDYDIRYPLFVNGNGGKAPSLLYQSFFAPYVEGLRSTISPGQDKEDLYTRITFTNSPIFDLYSYAYPFFSGITSARLILNIKDTLAFSTDNSSPAWNNKHLYNYQALFPPCQKEKVQAIMQNDLKNYFGYKVIPVEKEMNCWVLKILDKNKCIDFPKGLKHETNLFEDSGLPIYFNNYQLSALVNKLETLYNQPFLDETNIKQPVTLKLPANLHNITALKKSLAEQGLLLNKEHRKIRIIILSDK